MKVKTVASGNQTGDAAKVLKKAQIKGAKVLGGSSGQTVGLTPDQKLMSKVNQYSAKKKVKC